MWAIPLRSRKEETFKAMVLLIVQLARGRNGLIELGTGGSGIWEVSDPKFAGRVDTSKLYKFEEPRTCHTYLPLSSPGTHIEVCFKINWSL